MMRRVDKSVGFQGGVQVMFAVLFFRAPKKQTSHAAELGLRQERIGQERRRYVELLFYQLVAS